MDPCLEADVGRIDTEQAQSRVAVDVQVDESGCDQQAHSVDDLVPGGLQGRSDSNNMLALDEDIAREGGRPRTVDNRAVADQHGSSLHITACQEKARRADAFPIPVTP